MTRKIDIFEQLAAGVVTSSAEETQALAAELARHLPPDTTLALQGNLGVGKTTFVQGLAVGLGIRDAVTSPTFTVFTIYRSPDKGARTLVHLDAYRLETDRQIESLMLDDFLTSPYCLAVEWPEKIAAWLPRNTFRLSLSIDADSRHRVQLLSQ